MSFLIYTNMKKALFITLDNTLITTKSKQKYALHSEDWKFNNQAIACIKDFISKGFVLLIITNQQRIAQGLLSDKTFMRKMNLIITTLEKDLGLKSDSINFEYCTDVEDFNFLPSPGMIYQLALEFQLDIKGSYLLGSSVFDKAIINYCGIPAYIDITDLNYPI